MKNKKKRLFYFLIIFYISVFTANAQKLPAKQLISLRIPAGSKIDGEVTEWGNTFQAYNKSINAYYTLANDDDKLYLAVQATDPLIIRKIINGGITLTIEAGNKSNDHTLAITYPVFTEANRPVINLNDKPVHLKDIGLDTKQLDSFIYVVNKRFADKAKEIKVTGIPSITDPLISIYNENGIKVAVLFDDKATYTYELAIPLKYLNIAAGTSTKLNYTITLNGSPQIDGIKLTPVNKGNIIETMTVSIGPGAPSMPTISGSAILTSPTNLTGEYILAIK